MSDYRLFIDGKEVTTDVKDLNKVKLTVALDSKRQVVEYGTLSELEVKGDTAKLIDEFVTGCSGLDKELPAELVVKTADCGTIKVPLVVNARGSKCCPKDCKAYLSLSTSNADTKAKECLEKTLYYENGFAEAYNHPKVPYSIQLNDTMFLIVKALRDIFTVVVLSFFIATAAALLSPVLSVASIVAIVALKPLLQALDGFLSGTGRYIHGPLLREIFEYQAKQCGLIFKSSPIQNPASPRYDTALLCADVEHGPACDEDISLQVDNLPLMTVMELAEMYATAINGQVRIINGCMYIEKKDFFERFNGFIGDLVNDETGDEEICYSYDLDELCSNEEITWCTDSLETQGKRIARNYRKFITYEGVSNRKECKTEIPFASARFMYDELSLFGSSILDTDRSQDDFKDGGFFLFGNQSKKATRDLLVSGAPWDKCKLVVFEPGFDRDNAYVIREQLDTSFIPTEVLDKKFYTYNGPWQMEALCRDFFDINDPNIGKRPLLQVEGVKIRMTCQAVNQLLDRNVQAALNTHKGVGLADGWTICFNECAIEPEGPVRVYC